jgi:hypothetical protein
VYPCKSVALFQDLGFGDWDLVKTTKIISVYQCNLLLLKDRTQGFEDSRVQVKNKTKISVISVCLFFLCALCGSIYG